MNLVSFDYYCHDARDKIYDTSPGKADETARPHAEHAITLPFSQDSNPRHTPPTVYECW